MSQAPLAKLLCAFHELGDYSRTSSTPAPRLQMYVRTQFRMHEELLLELRYPESAALPLDREAVGDVNSLLVVSDVISAVGVGGAARLLLDSCDRLTSMLLGCSMVSAPDVWPALVDRNIVVTLFSNLMCEPPETTVRCSPWALVSTASAARTSVEWVVDPVGARLAALSVLIEASAAVV